MKALLQQLDTGLYFQGPGEWTPQPERAHDFKSSVTARTYCVRNGVEGVQIVLKFDVEKYDIVLPARQGRHQA
ncbi:MAG TPA: hypothetical protein VFB72_21110 [Verrucomicrobiae bacterium]|nr:hypothetical protein [Verrucomicrobiae bacterium]